MKIYLKDPDEAIDKIIDGFTMHKYEEQVIYYLFHPWTFLAVIVLVSLYEEFM